MTESEQTTNSAEIDQTIGRIEQLYRAMTGREIPAGNTSFAPIPAEKDPGEHVERQLNRLLKALEEIELAARVTPAAWIPPMCVWESGTEILVCMDLPGVRRDAVEVLSQGQVLTVSGVRDSGVRDSRERDGFELRSTECATGAFRRTILVPGGARATEPIAEMRDGVLEIRIQKEASRSITPKTVRVN